ncbi:hypothetical protein JCM8097_002390 [Rhodosporidiobolus ruineniae]
MPRFPRPSLAGTPLSSNSACSTPQQPTTPISERAAFFSPSSSRNSQLPTPSPQRKDSLTPPPHQVVLKVTPAASEGNKPLQPKLLILPSLPIPPLSAVASRAAGVLSLSLADGEVLVLSLVEREARWPGDEEEKVELGEESWLLYGWKKAVRRSEDFEPVRIEVAVRQTRRCVAFVLLAERKKRKLTFSRREEQTERCRDLARVEDERSE